jgi:deazaflavin-dependent oxidoreductase (nitroreductase family)
MSAQRRYSGRMSFGRRLVNGLARLLLRLGIGKAETALLETRGRVSGQPRVTPITNGLDGDTFWIVTEHGHQAQYVRNLLADPRVRVYANGRWRAGTAHLVPDDDTAARLRTLPQRNAAIVARVGTELISIRIDLDPA